MKVIDVYKQYILAECVYHGVQRKGVAVALTATSDGGNIRYEVSLSFFPHKTEDDFAISYDAYVSKEIYNAKGRRSKKREAGFLESLKETADSLAEELDAIIFWDKPLRDACFG